MKITRGKDDLQNPLSHLQWLPSRTPRIVGNKLRLDGCTLRVEMLKNIERVDINNKQVGPSNILINMRQSQQQCHSYSE